MKRKLKRNLNLLLLSLFGIGNILGAGIYVISGEVGRIAGMQAPLSFLLASFVALISALTYSEISSRYPVSSGEAAYVHRAFGSKNLGMLVGFSIAIAGMVSASAITRGFAGYFLEIFPISENVAMVGLLLVLGGVALWGIKEAAIGASILTIIEIVGLLIIIVVGRESIGELPLKAEEIFSLGSENASLENFSVVFLASFLAFYAFIGFEDMVNIAEEVKEPEKNMPRAIIISVLTASVLYFFVVYVVVTTLTSEELSNTKAPLAMVYERITDQNPLAITLIASFAVVNGALFQIVMASRIFYGMSTEGWLPGFLSKTSVKTGTPVMITVSVTLTIAVLALFFPVVTLAKFVSFIVLAVFILIHLSLLKLKKENPHPKGITTYPVFIPYLGVVICSLLLLVEILY